MKAFNKGLHMGILDKQQSCKHVTQAQISQRQKKG